MAFRDWIETAGADCLAQPIKGKTYRIPPLGYLDAIRWSEEMERIAAGEKPQISSEEVMTMLLGDELVKQMRADNVPEIAIVRAATVAGCDHVQGRDAAEEMWEHGPSPEALAAALKTAAAALESGTTSPNTQPLAPTSSTKPRASSASTKSPRKAAPRSTGRKSSPTRTSSRRTSSRNTT